MGLMSIFGLVQHSNTGDKDEIMVSDVLLGTNYNNRLLLMVGDGLWQSRLTGLFRSLEEEIYNYNYSICKLALNVCKQVLRRVKMHLILRSQLLEM